MVRNNNRFVVGNQAAVGTQIVAPMDDLSSPLYLHSGDHPGLRLVPTVLDGSNFNSWNRAMVTVLTAKNKLCFVDGSFPPPAADDLLYGEWKRCNSMLISWLLNAVNRDIANSLLCFDTAAEIWLDLRERFSQVNCPRIYQIKEQLMALQQGSSDINAYYIKLKTLWDELCGFQPQPFCNCGGLRLWADYQETEYVLQFLMGLNESYSAVRGQILLMDPLPPISKVLSLVIQEERQRNVNNSIPIVSDSLPLSEGTSMANAVNHPKNWRDKEKPVCAHCGRTNHTVDTCYKLHGFPPGNGKGKIFSQGKNGARGKKLDLNRAHVNHAASEKGNSAKNSVECLSPERLSSQLHLNSSPPADSQPNASISSFSEAGETPMCSESKMWKLLSYNVWFRKDLEMHKRMKAVGDLVELHSPDVICFQEVTPSFYEIFQQSSWKKGYWCSISDQMALPGAYFCMLLSKLPVKSSSWRPFHNSIMGRELCLAEVNVQPNITMAVATSHLESPCPSPPTWDQMFSKERVEQANEAVRLLEKNQNVIFCGDMNWDDKLDGPFPLMDGWVDAWTELRPGEVGWTYDTKSNKMLSGNRTLQKRLDRFFCKLKDFKVRKIEMIGTDAIPGLSYIKEKRVKGQVKELELPVLPSDHYGLLLTICPSDST